MSMTMMTSAPEPEVPEKPKRRRFTAEYKLRIVQAAARCTQSGELGALLRREGLYSSHLATWRQQSQSQSSSRNPNGLRKSRDPSVLAVVARAVAAIGVGCEPATHLQIARPISDTEIVAAHRLANAARDLLGSGSVYTVIGVASLESASAQCKGNDEVACADSQRCTAVLKVLFHGLARSQRACHWRPQDSGACPTTG